MTSIIQTRFRLYLLCTNVFVGFWSAGLQCYFFVGTNNWNRTGKMISFIRIFVANSIKLFGKCLWTWTSTETVQAVGFIFRLILSESIGLSDKFAMMNPDKSFSEFSVTRENRAYPTRCRRHLLDFININPSYQDHCFSVRDVSSICDANINHSFFESQLIFGENISISILCTVHAIPIGNPSRH